MMRLPFSSCAVLLLLLSCQIEPDLRLHRDHEVRIDLELDGLDLDSYWDYGGEETYDWRSEWLYGWDEDDRKLFGTLEYALPESFNLRRYLLSDDGEGTHLDSKPDYVKGYSHLCTFRGGRYDLLAWNDIVTLDGVQSLVFDEKTSLQDVFATTNLTKVKVRNQYPGTKSGYASHMPELLYSGQRKDISYAEPMDSCMAGDWVHPLRMVLRPVTYIYLTQIILHNNRGRIMGVDGGANLTGMAAGVSLNTGVNGGEAVAVYYPVRLKKETGGTDDIVGGRLVTFGLCETCPDRVTKADEVPPSLRNYLEVDMYFANGCDSTFVFDVTDRVRRRYKGGVITVELDVDGIRMPTRPGGSAFDAVVKDPDDSFIEIDM